MRDVQAGNARLFFASRKAQPRGNQELSTHEAAEDVFGAGAEGDYRLNIGCRARTQGAGDLDCGARLPALAERDGVRATLVGARLASRAFRAIERRGSGGFTCLGAQLSVSDASFCNEFDEREAQLVREQLVMRECSGRRWGLSHAPSRAGSVLAPHRTSRFPSAPARSVRVSHDSDLASGHDPSPKPKPKPRPYPPAGRRGRNEDPRLTTLPNADHHG